MSLIIEGDIQMGFVGNLNGPRKSDILEQLGAEFFGISFEAFYQEVEINLDEEREGIVDAVHVDKNGEPYFWFIVPDRKEIKKKMKRNLNKTNSKLDQPHLLKKKEKFYLFKNGYKLEGDIKTHTDKEQKYWQSREESKIKT